VPQREPLSAPLFGALVVVAALAACWLMLAVEGLAQGGVGALGGFTAHGIALPPPFGVPLVRQELTGYHTAWSWAALLLAGPAAAVAVGLGVHLLAEAFGAPAWLRVLAFEAFAIAWLRLPLQFLAAGLPGGGSGPLATLYDRLGEPESGRWAAVALGLLVLWGSARLVGTRSITMGRTWLRADGVGFQRRLVRLLAAYPFVVASVAFATVRPFGTVPLVVVGLGLVVAALTVRAP
jgi:hypothetical protein